MQAAPSPTLSPAPGASFSPSPPINTITPPLPPGVTFQDERCYQYFCHFRDVTSFEFSSGFDPSLWRSLVLGACDNFAIRRLVVATSALSTFVRGPPQRTSELHLEYALQRYGEALKGIRETVATGQDSTRVALISALLIFCFESLHGDLGRAMTHIQSAIDLILKQLSALPQQHFSPRIGPTGQQSNAPIDDELLAAFMRLDRPSLALMSRQRGYPPLPANRIFALLFSAEQFELPASFATISEARSYLEDIHWRVISTNRPPDAISALWEDSETEPNFPDFESIPWQLKQWFHATDFAGSSSHIAYRLAQWHDAFQPMLDYASSPMGESMFVPATILHVQAMAVDLTINGFAPHSPSHQRMDSFSSRSSSLSEHQSSFSTAGPSALAVPETLLRRRSSSDRSSPSLATESPAPFPTIHAILTFCRRLMSYPGFLKGFVFDAGVIPPLLKIVLFCPDRALKHEAIDVLRSIAPRREGMWDSRVCADAGEKCIAMEDTTQGLDMIDPFLLEGN